MILHVFEDIMNIFNWNIGGYSKTKAASDRRKSKQVKKTRKRRNVWKQYRRWRACRCACRAFPFASEPARPDPGSLDDPVLAGSFSIQWVLYFVTQHIIKSVCSVIAKWSSNLVKEMWNFSTIFPMPCAEFTNILLFINSEILIDKIQLIAAWAVGLKLSQC